MTKKHFEMIAREIRGVVQDGSTIFDLAHRLAKQFAEVNPRFDEERFLDAAGVLTEVKLIG